MANWQDKIFGISSEQDFNAVCLEIFRFQALYNPVYGEYLSLLGVNPHKMEDAQAIPHLPVHLFKRQRIYTGDQAAEITFLSSGTTGMEQSRHEVADLGLYRASFRKAFELFYGAVTEWCILALLPSYLEREGSSLIYMARDLINESQHQDSGFYLKQYKLLAEKLQELEAQGQKTLLLGVTYALLDLAEAFPMPLKNTIVMETGGMKGQRKEMVREALHAFLSKQFQTGAIHAEYGMTELLSQAYSKGNGTFCCPPWMRIGTREINDPFSRQQHGKTGGINIIDLSNVWSCSFLSTQDLGRTAEDGSFEVLGRFDHSDLRGCNLLVG